MEMSLREKINKTDFDLLFRKKGYTYYKEDYKLNIIGVRNNNIVQDDTYNDYIVITYKEGNHFIRKVFEFTTDPGLYYMKNPTVNKGVAILAEGQYIDTYKIDKHNNSYIALCQRLKSVKVFRDNNKDNKQDKDKDSIDMGMFGINLHKGSSTGINKINKNSAGC